MSTICFYWLCFLKIIWTYNFKKTRNLKFNGLRFSREEDYSKRTSSTVMGSGSKSIWDPGSASNKNQDPDLRHKIRIRTRIQSWIWIRINLQMTRQNVWNMSQCEHFFQGCEPLFGSKDPDPHQDEKSDPDLIKIWIRIRNQRDADPPHYTV